MPSPSHRAGGLSIRPTPRADPFPLLPAPIVAANRFVIVFVSAVVAADGAGLYRGVDGRMVNGVGLPVPVMLVVLLVVLLLLPLLLVVVIVMVVVVVALELRSLGFGFRDRQRGDQGE